MKKTFLWVSTAVSLALLQLEVAAAHEANDTTTITTPLLLPLTSPPQLNGQHFRVTAVPDGSFLKIHHDDDDDDQKTIFSGYLYDMFDAVASRANFTYKLVTPSGYGSACHPQLFRNATTITSSSNNNTATEHNAATEAYSPRYYYQFNCGEDDVNELRSTDMYLGLFYITPERLQRNYFTVPFSPPFKGTNAMYGFATAIPTIADLVKQQQAGLQPAACMVGSTANVKFIRETFPSIQIQEFYGGVGFVQAIDQGDCPVSIFPANAVTRLTLDRFQQKDCLIQGQPVGMIGEPLDMGLSHYAIGVGRHVQKDVVETLSYWLGRFMVDGTLSELYKNQGGTGKECGYVLYPTDDGRLLSKLGIVGVVLGAAACCLIPLYIWHLRRLRQQEQRYKKRFVQQIARNIQIGRRPGCIPADQLSDEILHIAKGKEVISKDDLSKWLHDVKMNFLTQRDFDALWNAMDVDRRGAVNAVDFVVFLSACGPQFEQVYDELAQLPKIEKLKLAARRLTNLESMGEEGVRQLERSLDRASSRGFVPSASTRSVTTSRRGSHNDLSVSMRSSGTSLLDCKMNE